jgi:hypothetical protein
MVPEGSEFDKTRCTPGCAPLIRFASATFRPEHTTDKVDFEVIVLGEVFLELDDGAEAFLKAGDCVIQNRARQRLAQPVVVRNCMFVSGCGTQTVAILLVKNPLTTNLE